MSLTHALSTNNYGPCRLIVATSAANGTHTTLTSAMAAASSGDTIFLRDSVTENVTITPGVNIVGWNQSSLNIPSITGTLTMSGAGTSMISGIRLVTNSAAVIVVSGSVASVLKIYNCYLDLTNNTGITYSSSSASSLIRLDGCSGNLGTTGIGLFTSTSPGELRINNCTFANSGGSTTTSSSSTTSVFFQYCYLSIPFVTASTGVVYFSYCNVNTSATNTTCFTTVGTGTSVIEYSDFISGTASALSVGTGTAVIELGPCRFDSSNTNVITGAGTFINSLSCFTGSSSGTNVTTLSSYTLKPTLKATAFNFTYDLTTATGSQVVTGKTTFTPIALIAITCTKTIGSTIYSVSGNDDLTNRNCLYSVSGFSPSTSVSMLTGNDGSNFQQGFLTAFSSTGWTVSWSKTGSPTGTGSISGIAIGYA